VRAAQLSVEDSRDLVVQSVGNAYLVIIADTASVDTVKAQVDTSQVLFQRASDQHAAGTAPAIDQLRAEVQLRSDQQSLLAAQNQLEKDKLSLARVIGMPAGQRFHVTDLLPFTPLQSMSVEETLRQAYANRADMKAMEQQVRAAELARGAAVAEYYPTVDLNADFGDAGVNLGSSHNVFGVTGSLNFNIFSGGRIKSEIEQADATLQQRRNELADLRGEIDQQVRTALLDLQSAADQVAVAQRNVQLAHETLTQSRDRFSAGVTDNLEVVQAQQSVVSADASLINSTYQHNLAKIELARSIGLTEQNLNRFIGGK
jgi:outer membrane protein TolC